MTSPSSSETNTSEFEIKIELTLTFFQYFFENFYTTIIDANLKIQLFYFIFAGLFISILGLKYKKLTSIIFTAIAAAWAFSYFTEAYEKKLLEVNRKVVEFTPKFVLKYLPEDVYLLNILFSIIYTSILHLFFNSPETILTFKFIVCCMYWKTIEYFRTQVETYASLYCCVVALLCSILLIFLHIHTYLCFSEILACLFSSVVIIAFISAKVSFLGEYFEKMDENIHYALKFKYSELDYKIGWLLIITILSFVFQKWFWSASEKSNSDK